MVKGIVRDKNNHLIEDADVMVLSETFEQLSVCKTDENGEFSIDADKEKAQFLICVKGYGDSNLEYWYTNINKRKSDKPLEIKFDKIEVYGLNAFMVYGAPSPLMVYFRPMSLTKFKRAERDIAPDITEENTKIYLNNIPCKILSVNEIQEDGGKTGEFSKGYLINVKTTEEINRELRQEIKVIFDDGNEFGMAEISIAL